MKMQRIIKRMAFYIDWYKCLKLEDQQSFTGIWVLQRIHWYDAALKDIEAGMAISTIPFTNYQSN